MSMASAAQLPLNTSAIAYTYQRYVRATLRGGDFLSPTEPALTPSVPIPRCSSFDVQKNGVRNCRTVRARPRAQSERDRTRPRDRKPLPEAVALIGRLECAPFRIRFFFFLVDVIRTATSPEYLRNVFSSDVTAPSVTQKTSRTL